MTNAVKQLFHQLDRDHLKIHNFIIFGKHLLRVSRPFRQILELKYKKRKPMSYFGVLVRFIALSIQKFLKSYQKTSSN